jgi:hypothetical protein
MSLGLDLSLWGGQFNPLAFSPSLWLTAGSGCYVDAAALFVKTDTKALQITDAAQTGLNPGTGDFSVAFWYYGDGTAFTYVLMGKGEAGGTVKGWYVFTPQTHRFGVRFNDGTGFIEPVWTSANFNAAGWKLCVINFDRDGSIIPYVNDAGVTIYSGDPDISAKTGSVTNALTFTLGSYQSVLLWSNGRLDSVGYWSRLLTAAERTHLYNAGSGLVYTDLTPAEKTGLVSWWELNEASGDRADQHGSNTLSETAATVGNAVGITRTICVNNDAVSYWTDRSGNAKHATQTTLAKRPTYLTGQINGRPVVYFDGSDDYLSTALAGLVNATIFFAGTIEAAAGAVIGVDDSSDKSMLGSNTTDKFGGGVGAQDYDTIASNDDPGIAMVGVLTYDGTTVSLHRNGVQEYSQAQSGDVTTANAYFIGALNDGATPDALNADANLAEIIVYPEALSAPRRMLVERYLANKYGVSI